MGSPSPRGRSLRRRSLLSLDDASVPYALPTRTGTLASLIRSRSQQSLTASRLSPPIRHAGSDDVEAANWARHDDDIERLLRDETRLSQILKGPQVRSMNLIGRSNRRYTWARYWKSDDELQAFRRPIRDYYKRINDLVQGYMYIDCLLDSSIPHDLLNEYSAELEASAFRPLDVPATISEEPSYPQSQPQSQSHSCSPPSSHTAAASYGATSPGLATNGSTNGHAVRPSLPPKRTPKDIFLSSESLPLLQHQGNGDHAPAPTVPPSETGPKPYLSWLEDGDKDSDDPIVTLAIWVNLIANIILLGGKIAVILSVPSMSVLASLVDSTLDFLSTAIIWITTRLISSGQKDQYRYPVGRRRLEPLGVLVFSVIMVTSFVQVALECIQRLARPEHEILQLGTPAIIIMASTIFIKGACWIWCRVVKNSSVQALFVPLTTHSLPLCHLTYQRIYPRADDAKTDVMFNLGSILFPIVGYYGKIWWLDATGGLLLSFIVIFVWSQTSAHHVRNLTGFSAQPDERNILLYLTMRFATAIRRIQNLRAYHAGDKLFVEVDIVLSAITPLKDSHDLSEVLTYFLESVPIVDRAFVHVDYASYNAPTHMLKQSST